MDRKKKKTAAQKAAVNQKQQLNDLKSRFVTRTTDLLALYGNAHVVAKIPHQWIERLFEYRYSVLKAKPAADATIDRIKLIHINKYISESMKQYRVPLSNGNEVPLDWWVSEGVTLLNALEVMDDEKRPEDEEILKHFRPHFFGGKSYQIAEGLILDILEECTRLLGDFNDCLIRIDITDTTCFSQFNVSNDVIIRTFKPELNYQLLDRNKRPSRRLGWVNDDFKWKFSRVRPSTLGFKVGSLDIPLPVYVHQHALDRLKERVNVIPGVMHEILFHLFNQDQIEHQVIPGASLVMYPVADEKVGYLVVKLHADKVVVHTFLFLTNNGTPEGAKLKKLLEIEKADKQYLEIDNLPAFNAYRIDQNQTLSTLFRTAGCGSLLKLGHLQAFTENDVKDKDPESILKYLTNAPYFRKEPAHSTDSLQLPS
jgi:hypothetical protein